jgi:hypothetical protein
MQQPACNFTQHDLFKSSGEIRDFRNINAEIGVSFEPGTSRTLSENYTPKPISLGGRKTEREQIQWNIVYLNLNLHASSFRSNARAFESDSSQPNQSKVLYSSIIDANYLI